MEPEPLREETSAPPSEKLWSQWSSEPHCFVHSLFFLCFATEVGTPEQGKQSPRVLAGGPKGEPRAADSTEQTEDKKAVRKLREVVDGLRVASGSSTREDLLSTATKGFEN